MVKVIRNFMCIMLSVTLLLGTGLTVFAETIPPNLGDVVDGSVLTDDVTSETEIYNPSRGNILNRGIARISNNGNNSVNIYGAVTGAVVCDKLQLSLTLQRLEGNTWVTVTTYSDTAYGQVVLSKSYNRSVTSGYYYRVKAACVATKGSTSEYQMPITDGLWI